MKIFSKFTLTLSLVLGATSVFADALSAKPLRVGPVQNYGVLGTSGGKVVSLKTNKEVMLRGMSFFWSDALGIQYYNPEVVKWAADSLGVTVLRFAMGIQYYDSQGNDSEPMDTPYSYMGDPTGYKAKIDVMVQAAIENDIYLIIDWHSHRAEHEQAAALAFFTEMAQKYANIPNVIFEIYNEPVHTAWSTIQNYANTVSAAIRTHSPNLILVGTPSWSQLGSYGGVNATNVAYVFHFYAGSHSVGSYSNRITAAKNAGHAVFISEWGTTSASGNGSPDVSATNSWINFMETNRISNCNWSLRQYTSTIDGSSEESALLSGNSILNKQTALASAQFTTSGNIVKNYLTSHKSNWADSLTAGKSGSCSVTNQIVKETAGTISLKNGCTYTSSDEAVVKVNGNSASIIAPGYALLTGNDGSVSVITVESEPAQTVTGFVDFTCRLNGSCSASKRMGDLSKTGAKEVSLSYDGLTQQGATFTVKSLNPQIVDIKKAVCSNSSYCYGNYFNNNVYMFDFKGVLGSAQIVITAPAVTGYRALNDTITVTYAKTLNKMPSTFKKRTMTFGEIAENGLPDTAHYAQAPVTYTYNGLDASDYISKVGTNLVAGSQNAIVKVTATAPETETTEAMNISVVVVVGDSTQAVNKDEYYATTPILKPAQKVLPFRAEIQDNGILLQVQKSGLVEWGLYSVSGKSIHSEKKMYSVGTHLISFETIPTGSYFMKVRQGSKQNVLRWEKLR